MYSRAVWVRKVAQRECNPRRWPFLDEKKTRLKRDGLCRGRRKGEGF